MTKEFYWTVKKFNRTKKNILQDCHKKFYRTVKKILQDCQEILQDCHKKFYWTTERLYWTVKSFTGLQENVTGL